MSCGRASRWMISWDRKRFLENLGRFALVIFVMSCRRFVIAAVGAVLFASLFGGKSKSASDGEYIIVSGGPALRKWEDLRKKVEQHDRWWGNFIRSAKFRMTELFQKHGSRLNITWMVYRPAYVTRANESGQPYVQFVESVRDDYFAGDLNLKINLVWFSEGKDVINYINRGRNRKNFKITGFEYFGHSNRHAFMFDYSNIVSGASRAWLHEDELKRIKRKSFARGAYCKSWGCHTAESMSKKWKSATGVGMWGALGKTDYTPLQDDKLPMISGGGYWKR